MSCLRNEAEVQPTHLARLPVRYQTLENELEAVEAAIEKQTAALGTGSDDMVDLQISARISELTGMRAILRWLVLGYEEELPPSVRIGAWRAEDEREGR